MTTAHTSKKSAHAHTTATPSETPQAAPSPATPEPPAPATTAASPPPIIFVVGAVPTTPLPAIPDSFVPVDLTYYRGYVPKGAQLTFMPGAVQDLKSFPNWAGVFGMTMPPQDVVVQAFETASGWSTFHTKMEALEIYAGSEEALAWYEVHGYIGRLQDGLASAAKSSEAIATAHVPLTRFLAAQSEIAQQGAATRKANKQAVAEGKPPTKGKVGKRRRKSAANALYEAATKAQATQTPPPPATPAAANGAPGVTPPTGNTPPHS